VADFKETHVVKSESGSSTSPWLAFIVGALLIAVVALLVINVHGTVQGPAGRIDFNVKPPATSPAPAAPAPAAPTR
jgi:hypothetical protein